MFPFGPPPSDPKCTRPRAQFANRVARAAPLAMSAVAAPSTKLPASVKPGVVTGQALVNPRCLHTISLLRGRRASL